MLSLKSAISLAEQHFPRGPEEIANRLGVAVTYASFSGCDGWCVTRGESARITINSSVAKSRQRFTLAHELAHLLMGTEPGVVLSASQIFTSNRVKERSVNQLTAQILLPKRSLKSLVSTLVPALPVDANALKRIAKRANVSQLMAACRISTLCTELGLKNAAVILFKDEKVRWVWSKTLQVPSGLGPELLDQARRAAPSPYRFKRKDGLTVTACILGDPQSPTLFVQLLPSEIASKPTSTESRRGLETRCSRMIISSAVSSTDVLQALKTNTGPIFRWNRQ